MLIALLDTSVLIGEDPPPDVPSAISAASLAELHFGVVAAADDAERAARLARLSAIERTFDALPIDGMVAAEWGRLLGAVKARGGAPRRRAVDLAIAATASVYGYTLVTRNPKDFSLIGDLVSVRAV